MPAKNRGAAMRRILAASRRVADSAARAERVDAYARGERPPAPPMTGSPKKLLATLAARRKEQAKKSSKNEELDMTEDQEILSFLADFGVEITEEQLDEYRRGLWRPTESGFTNRGFAKKTKAGATIRGKAFGPDNKTGASAKKPTAKKKMYVAPGVLVDREDVAVSAINTASKLFAEKLAQRLTEAAEKV